MKTLASSLAAAVQDGQLQSRDWEAEGTNLHLPLLLEQAARCARQARLAGPVPGAEGRGLPVAARDRAEGNMAGKTAGKTAVKTLARAVAALLVLLAFSSAATQSSAAAAGKKSDASAKQLSGGGNPAAESLAAYLARVRLENKAVQPTPGSIWTDSGLLTRMSTDVRARRPHDLISVIVSENLAAETDGTVKNSRASNASSGISGLIGALHAGNALQNLVNQNSASALNAQGASASNSSLTTTLGGQVVEVLPNGVLVIEAARQVEFAQQVQTIILRGLVRPEDISQQNQVMSTAISSLEVQVRGKGIVNDYTHRQNPLVRFLQWALVF